MNDFETYGKGEHIILYINKRRALTGWALRVWSSTEARYIENLENMVLHCGQSIIRAELTLKEPDGSFSTKTTTLTDIHFVK